MAGTKRPRAQRPKPVIEDAVKQLQDWDKGKLIADRAREISDAAGISEVAARAAAKITVNEEWYMREVVTNTLLWVLGEMGDLPYVIEQVTLEGQDDGADDDDGTDGGDVAA